MAEMLPTPILFVGGLGNSPVEQLVAGAHRAIAFDTLDRIAAGGVFARPVVVTDQPGLARSWGGDALEEPAGRPFHFGRQLQNVIHRHGVAFPFYIGGGAAPLLQAPFLAQLARELAVSANLAVTNNYFSSDMVAFTPGAAIDTVPLPPTDNPLARLLVEAGLQKRVLPREAATQFDVDTPTDLAILQLHPAIGPRTRAYLDSINLDSSRLRKALAVFNNRDGQIIVAGRAGSHLWAQLEQKTACRVRFLSEERGLRGDGREEVGNGGSILGFYLQEVGPRRFFNDLARLGDAAFIDSRVIFHHLHLHPSAKDRFLSDLGEDGEIEEPFVREFTREAVQAPIPVVLGGQSVVSGGLLALLEVAGAQ